MARGLKATFGVMAILMGVASLALGLGHPWLMPTQPFSLAAVLWCVPWSAILLWQGRRWLFNIADLSDMHRHLADADREEAQQRAQSTLSTLQRHLAEHQHQCLALVPWETEEGPMRIWATVHSQTGENLVVSEPVPGADQLGTVSARKLVPLAEVADWQVPVSETETHGAYSFLALARTAKLKGYRLSAKESKRLEAIKNAEPV